MAEIIFLGSIYGKKRQGYDGSVYSYEGVIPSILTNSITNNKMFILEKNMDIKKIGNCGERKTQSRSVYDTEGVCPTLAAGMDHCNTMPYILVENGDNDEEKRTDSLQI